MKRDPLPVLVAVNVLASLLHYGHNMLFFASYPEPAWISTGRIDLFWFFMTPFALLGYHWHRKGARSKATVSLIAYGLMSSLVLGHYRYASFSAIPFQIHLFIWVETLCAAALMGYVLWLWFDGSARTAS
jgi:hypothetical protein